VHDTSHFSNNSLQTDYFTVSQFQWVRSVRTLSWLCHETAWKIPENDFMALEASDRLIWRAHLQTQSIFAWHYGKIKRNQPRPQKTIVDLPKSDSSLGVISKCLKVPRSSVQKIVRKYKHHGAMQLSYHSGRRRVLSPKDERTLVRKVQINPRTTATDLVKMLEETGTKLSISTVKWVIYWHNLKGRSAMKKTRLQNHHKKARLRFATAQVDKDCTFWRKVLWSDETKIHCSKNKGNTKITHPRSEWLKYYF
jgi:transposase